MPEIDLIPTDYRERLVRRAALLKYVVALVSANAMIVVAGLILARIEDQKHLDVLRLQSENAMTQQQQQQLEQVNNQYDEHERRWSLLRGLRAGAAVEEIFTLIDRCIVADELWFLEWSFQRAGVIIDGEQRGIETGYFIIVDDAEAANPTSELSIETRMTIHGQAKDHASLSTFVRTLFEQRDVKDVNLQKTSRAGYANGRVVDFNITIILNNAIRGS